MSARARLRGVAGLVTALVVGTGALVGGGATARAADLSQFNPGNIISDAVFFDKWAMDEGEIQEFFVSKLGSCEPGATCLINWRGDTYTRSADAQCGAYEGAPQESAARIIYKTAQACGINPRVLIVMLQKEQGLVTKRNPSARAWRSAMGYACPDTAPCDAAFYGFYNQVYKAAWQMRRYAVNVAGFRYRAGQWNTIQWHPNIGCGTSDVFIENQATANLYNYTPYRPNQAALDARYGTGDGCSSYGNRNFYQYFVDWFGSTEYVFRDLNGMSPFVTEVTWLNERRISTGYPDGTFRLYQPVERGAMAAFLYRLAESPAFTPPAISPFSDVPPTHQFYKEITWLATTGVAAGYADGSFRPVESVNRDAMAAFMYRFQGSPEFAVPESTPFGDVTIESEFAREISWLAAEGISTGWEEDAGCRTYRPLSPVNRDAMAAFMYRLVNGGTTGVTGPSTCALAPEESPVP